MLEQLSWKTLLLELALCCFPALLAGIIFGHAGWWLCLGFALLLLWHFWNLLRLSWWLWRDKSIIPPVGHGSWEPLFYGLHQMQQRNKKRRAELARLIKRFRSGAESLPDALVLITDEGTIFWCNRLAQQLLGLRWPDDRGQNILNLVRQPEFSHYLLAKPFAKPLELAVNNGRHLEFRLMPYSDSQWLLVVRDVSQMYQLEQVRNNFFANVSHELRTPLTVLQGYLELMGDQALDEARREKIQQTMTEQTQRMAGLIKQLLTLSKIEASPALPGEKVHVAQILHSLENQLQSLGSQHHLHWQTDNSLQVFGHEDQLHSAISNLIFNAVIHTPPGSSINISWQRVAQGALFSVQDNGEGIAPEHLPHLTERFYRVDLARSRKTGGSGLGLAIVKHALSHHDSRLEIHSKPGQGACFSFLLAEYLIVK